MTARRLAVFFSGYFGSAVCAIVLSLAPTAASAADSTKWTVLARQVGQSEEYRARAIRELKQRKNLSKELRRGLKTSDRPLALEVISALEIKSLVPDMMELVPTDNDGFLILGLNSMMENSNRAKILSIYLDRLQPKSLSSVSPGALMAILEPIGRLGVHLPRGTADALEKHKSPEVRGSLLYYTRIMALRHRDFVNASVVDRMTRAPEYQLRLQAESIQREIRSSTLAKSFSTYLLKALFGQPAWAADSCSVMKKSLFAKSAIEVRMIFGYKDARPARFVGDRHERLAFIEKMTAPCGGENQACGFYRSIEDADLLTKPIEVNGRTKVAKLYVVNSSVGSDDEENLKDPFQDWKSKHAETAFLTGLKTADVVFYNGHSRFGGGPDFGSPKLAKDGTVSTAAYKSNKQGISKLIRALEESRKPKSKDFSGLKVLGLYSCTSSQHFNRRIRSSSEAGLISSNALMYYSDALEQSVAALNTILQVRCPKSIQF